MFKIVILVCIFLSSINTLAFKKKNIVFDNRVKLRVEVAESQKERAMGLMHRASLGKREGMLFIFPSTERMSFWMKNTYIPLSIGYFGKDRRLFQIVEMFPALGPVRDQELKSYPSQKEGKYALEVNIGWFKQNKVKIGSKFKFN